jgi:hypothetical protein
MSIIEVRIATLIIKHLIIKFSFYVIIFTFIMNQNILELIKIKINAFIQTFQPSLLYDRG